MEPQDPAFLDFQHRIQEMLKVVGNKAQNDSASVSTH